MCICACVSVCMYCACMCVCTYVYLYLCEWAWIKVTTLLPHERRQVGNTGHLHRRPEPSHTCQGRYIVDPKQAGTIAYMSGTLPCRPKDDQNNRLHVKDATVYIQIRLEPSHTCRGLYLVDPKMAKTIAYMSGTLTCRSKSG